MNTESDPLSVVFFVFSSGLKGVCCTSYWWLSPVIGYHYLIEQACFEDSKDSTGQEQLRLQQWLAEFVACVLLFVFNTMCTRRI